VVLDTTFDGRPVFKGPGEFCSAQPMNAYAALICAASLACSKTDFLTSLSPGRCAHLWGIARSMTEVNRNTAKAIE
jgi:hypothetical protein